MRVAESVGGDADRLLLHERENLDAAGLGDRLGIDRDVGTPAEFSHQRAGVTPDQADSGADLEALGVLLVRFDAPRDAVRVQEVDCLRRK